MWRCPIARYLYLYKTNSNENIDDQSINDLNHSVLIPMPTPINTRYPKITACITLVITFTIIVSASILLIKIFELN